MPANITHMLIAHKARNELRNTRTMDTAFKTHITRLLTKTQFLTTNRIFKTGTDRDIVKA